MHSVMAMSNLESLRSDMEKEYRFQSEKKSFALRKDYYAQAATADDEMRKIEGYISAIDRALDALKRDYDDPDPTLPPTQ